MHVILATCTAAYSDRIMKPCKGFVSQCIIDECAMCIEAQTLCGMLGSQAEQIVLIGDHKQLRPIIKCKKARELGLERSMFERYSKEAMMLKIQYRMVSILIREILINQRFFPFHLYQMMFDSVC